MKSMNSVDLSQIVLGKRKRVMSTEGVLSVVSNMLPKELNKQKKKTLQVDHCPHSESSSDVKVSDTKGRTKTVPAKIAQEPTEESKSRVKANSKKNLEVPKEPVIMPSKVKITKAALKELINKHFIIVDEQQPVHPITKRQKVQIVLIIRSDSRIADKLPQKTLTLLNQGNLTFLNLVLQMMHEIYIYVVYIQFLYKLAEQKYYNLNRQQLVRDGVLKQEDLLCPGMLHSAKIILLDNGFMSIMAIYHRFHEFTIGMTQEQQTQIEAVLIQLCEEDFKDFKKIQEYANKIPKFMGDLWESVAAALLKEKGWQGLVDIYGKWYGPYIQYVFQNLLQIYDHYQCKNKELQSRKK